MSESSPTELTGHATGGSSGPAEPRQGEPIPATGSFAPGRQLVNLPTAVYEASYKATYGTDIFNEPDGDPDTLSNLGPLAPLAGTWEGQLGADAHPSEDGTEDNVFLEHYDLQPIDRQTNGPQLFYGLRYHTHIVKPGEVETFHDQVGYWLWEPATETVSLSIAIPRGQVVLAGGTAAKDATQFEVNANISSQIYGTLSNPYLYREFRTESFKMVVTINSDGTWSYEQDTVMAVSDRAELFHHTDRNTLSKVAEAKLNPMAGAI